jgi:hypothetical protein
LSTVSRRLGHASERTTERSYIGVQRNQAPGPFKGVPLRTLDRESKELSSYSPKRRKK